jgi:SAM-dependent methyltransferase
LRLYSELAAWWPLMSPPPDYVEEAADLLPLLRGEGDPPHPPEAARPTLLELGCGGGSLASHLKQDFTLTLTDISPGMLDVSRQVNPECEHVEGDMMSLDLGRTFDRVLVHDAIMYATTPDAVRATLHTAARHCRPDGLVVVVPDCVKETFEPETEHGGEDAPGGRGRALRYLMWTWDPDPTDCTFEVIYAFALRDADGCVTVEQDHHREGVFPRADWLAWFAGAGLDPRIHVDPWARDVFIARKRSRI